MARPAVDGDYQGHPGQRGRGLSLFVDHDRLNENERHGWLELMAGKSCDLEDFIEAFQIACLLTNTDVPDLDEKLKRARAIKKRGEEYDARIDAEARSLGYADGELYAGTTDTFTLPRARRAHYDRRRAVWEV